MKNKAPLMLMEQLVIVLVFALAAAVCLRVFVFSDRMSRENDEKDRAVLAVQSAAETIKSVRGDWEKAAEVHGGSFDGAVWSLYYDGNGAAAGEEEAAYVVRVTAEERGQPLLEAADVRAETMDGKLLFRVSAAWQKEDGHEGG